jgi:hypothetical protein
LILVLVLTWFAPAIVAHCFLRNWLIREIFSDLQGSITIGRASVGWFSPVVLEDVEIQDPSGKRLATIPRLESRKALLRLLLKMSDIGSFRLEKPLLEVVFDGEKSNLEQVLASWLAPGHQTASVKTAGVELEVVEGRVSIEDRDAQEKWELHPLELSLTLPRNWSGPMQISMRSPFADARQPGRFEGDLLLERTANAAGAIFSSGNVDIRLDALPIAVGQCFLRRAVPVQQLGGKLSGTVQGQWGADDAGRPVFNLEGKLTGDGLTGTSPWMEGDFLRLDHLDFPFHVAATGNRLRLERAEVLCDLGQASIVGVVDTDKLNIASLARSRFEAGADIDVARLANLLPRTMHLKHGSRITSGKLHLDLSSSSGPERSGVSPTYHKWQGKLQTSDILAVNDGRPIAVREPIQVDFAAHEPSKGLPVIDRLRCTSSFLKVEGSGSLERFTATATYDLNQLTAQLNQIIDLGAIQLAGRGSSRWEIRSQENGHFAAQGEGQLQQFQCTLSGGRPWIEELVTLRLDVTGDKAPEGTYRFDLGNLQLTSSTLNAQAPQMQVLFHERGGMSVTGKAMIQGDLARLQEWIQPPRRASWRKPDVAPPATGIAESWSGKLVGEITCQKQNGLLSVQFDGNLLDPTVGPSTKPLWRENRVHLHCQATMEEARDLVKIDLLQVESPALGCEAQGTISKWSGSREVQIAGKLAYDAKEMSVALRNALGNGVWITGKDSRPFHLQGSLANSGKPPTAVVGLEAPNHGAPITPMQTHEPEAFATALSAEASFHWTAANFYGFQAGPAELQAYLKDGWLRFHPVETTVNGGRLRVEPAFRLETGAGELQLAPGTIISRVGITPAMCEQALAYIAPVLADVVDVQGQFSLAMDACRIPYGNPAAAQLGGKFVVHNVKVNTSPLIRELSALLGRTTSADLKREAVIPFQMVNGRVYHRDLELVFPELTIRTSGSVGLDGTLAMIAEMPIPQKWLPSSKVGQAMAKQSIRLPIAGTLKKPKVDEATLRRITAQIASETAGELLRQQVDKKIDKLIRPNKE